MVFGLADLAWLGKQAFQVTTPTGGVFTIAHAVHLGPIQYTFDAPTHTGGRHCLGRPDGREAGHDRARSHG